MKKIYYLIILSFFLGSCSLFDNEEFNPAYLVIEDVDISTTSAQGPPTHKITDVWVYVDDQLLGVFPLPATIPIIVEEGRSSNIRVDAGIRNNGELSRAFFYRPLKPVVFDEDLSPGETITRAFTFEYRDNLIFDFVEGFESPHIFTEDLDEDEGTFIDITDEDSASGERSGKIVLSGENDNWRSSTPISFAGIENTGIDAYLEMEYKNDIPFTVGVIYRQGSEVFIQPLIILNEKNDWNKIYVDFTIVLSDPQIDSYRVYFGTDLEDFNRTEGTIYLDNLKFLHF